MASNQPGSQAAPAVEAIISHLSWVSLFLGFHTLGLYVHNDVVVAFGTPEKQILVEPVFAQWILNPLKVKPIAHGIWDPHFGETALKAFTRGGVIYPVNIALSGVYQWWYTIGMRTNQDLYVASIFLLVVSLLLLQAGWLHLQPQFKPSIAWFKNNESRLNHHLSGLFGVSSLAWTGHLVHVAIPESRGIHVGWDNFLTILPHPAGLTPFFTGNWSAYAENADTSSHVYNTLTGAGTAILTFKGGFHPQTQSLLLTDIAHHHLAIAVLFIIAGHMYRTNFGIGHSMKEILEAHRPPGGRLGKGHIGLYETITNSLHMQLGLALAGLDKTFPLFISGS